MIDVSYDSEYYDDQVKRVSKKTKLDKKKFCKKNKLGGGKYGPHIYEGDSNSCSKCGHLRKKRNYEYG